nr:MAG TPA: hypothetical protein [Caudoviricetes sp.]
MVSVISACFNLNMFGPPLCLYSCFHINNI